MSKSSFFAGQPIFSQVIKFIPRAAVARIATKQAQTGIASAFPLMTTLLVCYMAFSIGVHH